MRQLLIGLVLLLAGCSAPPVTPVPTPTAPVRGSVSLLVPQPGTTYYAETLTVRGTASDLPATGFVLRLLLNNTDTAMLLSVTPQGNEWSVLIPFERTEPAALLLRAESTDGSHIYAETSAALAPLADRPAGTYGTIFSPETAQIVGGEQLQVRGVVAGQLSDSVQLTATDENGQVFASATILLPVLTPLDEIPFTVDLVTDGTRGPVILRLLDGTAVLDETAIMVSDVAG